MADLTFVTFKKEQGIFKTYIPMNQFLSSSTNIEAILTVAANLYEQFLTAMRIELTDVNNYRVLHKPLPAGVIWRLGDRVFRFVEALAERKLEIDGIYEHLSRDLNVKRKWLEKVIILRRYIPDEHSIPESVNWGYFEKVNRRKAEELMKEFT